MNNIGYKVTDKNMRCRGFQYKVGTTFKHDGAIRLCGSGFHFCKKLVDCFSYYSFTPDNRVFEVEYGATVIDGDDKSVTNEITFIRELSWHEVLELVNTGKCNTGMSNTGDYNSGDSNTGDWNTGHRNTGHRNTGDSNTGDFCSGYRSSGVFCTEKNPKILMFDQPTDITVKEWELSRLSRILSTMKLTEWVSFNRMTDEEKAQNPKAVTTGGYLKVKTYHQMWADFWNGASKKTKQLILDLPNFDPVKFKEITGIDVKKEK